MNWIKVDKTFCGEGLEEGDIVRTESGYFCMVGEVNTSLGTNDEYSESITHYTKDRAKEIQLITEQAEIDYKKQYEDTDRELDYVNDLLVKAVKENDELLKKYIVGFKSGNKITISQEILNELYKRIEMTTSVIQRFSLDNNCFLIINTQEIEFINEDNFDHEAYKEFLNL